MLKRYYFRDANTIHPQQQPLCYQCVEFYGLVRKGSDLSTSVWKIDICFQSIKICVIYGLSLNEKEVFIWMRRIRASWSSEEASSFNEYRKRSVFLAIYVST